MDAASTASALASADQVGVAGSEARWSVTPLDIYQILGGFLCRAIAEQKRQEMEQPRNRFSVGRVFTENTPCDLWSHLT